MEPDEVNHSLVGLSMLIPAFIVIPICVVASGIFFRAFRRHGGSGLILLLVATVSTIITVMVEARAYTGSKSYLDPSSDADTPNTVWWVLGCLYACGSCLVVSVKYRGEQAEDSKPDHVPS